MACDDNGFGWEVFFCVFHGCLRGLRVGGNREGGGYFFILIGGNRGDL